MAAVVCCVLHAVKLSCAVGPVLQHRPVKLDADEVRRLRPRVPQAALLVAHIDLMRSRVHANRRRAKPLIRGPADRVRLCASAAQPAASQRTDPIQSSSSGRAPAPPLHACARKPSTERARCGGSEWAPRVRSVLRETHTGADNSQLWTLQGYRTVEYNIQHTSVLAGRSAPSSTFIPVAFCSAASLSGVSCDIRRTVEPQYSTIWPT